MALVKYSAEDAQYWKTLIEESRVGSQSVEDFCRERRISKKAYYNWLQRFKKRHPAWHAQIVQTNHRSKRPKAQDPVFVPVQLVSAAEESPPKDGPIEIRLAGGHVILVPARCARDLFLLLLGKC